MIKAFEFGNFRLIGRAKNIPEMIAAMAAQRGQYNQWREEQQRAYTIVRGGNIETENEL